jgi:membrane-associated protease RseP (regulator of RpoE activity)
MTKTNLLTAIFWLPMAASSAFAHPVAQTAQAVLHANQEAMGDLPKAGTLRVQYAAEVNGLKGTATYTIDLATGMFIDELQDVVAGLSEAKGGSFSDPSYDGSIGSGFLKRFAVTFDYSHQTMYLQRVSPAPVDAGRFDRSGMWINAVTDAYEIKSIAANSPAAQAGLAEGDLITSLNGQPAVAAQLSDARTMLRALPASTEFTVTYKRNGGEQHTTLKLRDQI